MINVMKVGTRLTIDNLITGESEEQFKNWTKSQMSNQLAEYLVEHEQLPITIIQNKDPIRHLINLEVEMYIISVDEIKRVNKILREVEGERV